MRIAGLCNNECGLQRYAAAARHDRLCTTSAKKLPASRLQSFVHSSASA